MDNSDWENAPTLAALYQQANASTGLACPRCGCEHLDVYDSRPLSTGPGRLRKRICRNPTCHTEFETVERIRAIHPPDAGSEPPPEHPPEPDAKIAIPTRKPRKTAVRKK